MWETSLRDGLKQAFKGLRHGMAIVFFVQHAEDVPTRGGFVSDPANMTSLVIYNTNLLKLEN
ncbi:MAG: hypothetical protein H5U08_14300 [Thermogutta sp.]|nr:hypothetical protein [Thermogutta sp.]